MAGNNTQYLISGTRAVMYGLGDDAHQFGAGDDNVAETVRLTLVHLRVFSSFSSRWCIKVLEWYVRVLGTGIVFYS